jgi:hypothetical protein
MDLSKLSKEEKEKLFADLKAEKQAEEQRKEQDRETYKRLKDEAVREIFGMLQELSQKMISLKGIVFSRFDTIIGMKDDLYNSKSERQSDTFTTEDNTVSIKLGNRVNEGWDDTVEVGVEKVKQYLKTLAKNEETGNLVDTVMRLLSKNNKRQLKASKVLELEQLAMKSNSDDFKEAIQIIKDAYRPVPTCQFIEVRYRDENGKELSLPLSMSAIN